MTFALASPPTRATATWLEHAVFGLDRWLRRRQGVYEYSTADDCLFRIQRARAEEPYQLSDGTQIAAGDPILILHLWNEHVPTFPPGGAGIAWAREVSRVIDISLHYLADYLASDPALDDVAAIRADMRLGPGEQVARLSARFGFEVSHVPNDSAGALHRFGESILIFMLVMASNPAAARASIFWRRERRLVYLSRAALERRYAANAASDARKGAPC